MQLEQVDELHHATHKPGVRDYSASLATRATGEGTPMHASVVAAPPITPYHIVRGHVMHATSLARCTARQ